MNQVLVIDDDVAVLNSLKVFLLQAGTFNVKTLSDSTRAYEELRNNAYDLLLLDMHMPEVTGIDILKHIQENNVDIDTIILTGVEDVTLAVSAIKLGAIEYLIKPVENQHLLNLINTVVENRKKQKIMEQESPAGDLKHKEAFQEIITQNEKMKKKCFPSYVLESTAPIGRGAGDAPLKTLEEMEKDYIKNVCAAMEGNKTRTAQILRISRIGLISKIKKYKLE